MSVRAMRESVESGAMPRGSKITAAGFSPEAAVDAKHAFDGSLDAAKRMHDVLLHGWTASLSQSAEHLYWLVRETKHFQSVSRASFGTDPQPARAWLIAILRALEEEGKWRDVTPTE